MVAGRAVLPLRTTISDVGPLLALHGQLAEFIEFQPQPVAQGALGSQFIKQGLTSSDRLFGQFATLKQTSPTP